jgi:hypothetical protein
MFILIVRGLTGGGGVVIINSGCAVLVVGSVKFGGNSGVDGIGG